MFLHCNLFYVTYFTSHMICCRPTPACDLLHARDCNFFAAR